MRGVLICLLAILCFIDAARAATPQESDIASFCASPNIRKPFPGKQFNGDAADPTVLGLKPGFYPLNDDGYVEVVEKGVWLLKKPKSQVAFFAATAYSGGQIHTAGSLIGGCSLEFLSEILIRNHISLLSATPVARDELPNTREPGQLP